MTVALETITRHFGGHDLTAIDMAGTPVLIARQVGDLVGSPRLSDQVRQSNEYLEGKHYIVLRGKELKDLKDALTHLKCVSPNTSNLTLFTEDGFLLAALRGRSRVGRELRDKVVQMLKEVMRGRAVAIQNGEVVSAPKASSPCEDWRLLRERRLLDREHRLQDKIQLQERKLRAEGYDGLIKYLRSIEFNEQSIQNLQVKKAEVLTGDELPALKPQLVETWYRATAAGQLLGISAYLSGKTAKRIGLQSGNGVQGLSERLWDTAKHAHKEVPNWRYTKEGVHAVAKQLGMLHAGGSTEPLDGGR